MSTCPSEGVGTGGASLRAAPSLVTYTALVMVGGRLVLVLDIEMRVESGDEVQGRNGCEMRMGMEKWGMGNGGWGMGSGWGVLLL